MAQMGPRIILVGFGVSIVISLGVGMIGQYLQQALTSDQTTVLSAFSISSLGSLGVIAGILLLMEGLHLQYVDWIRGLIQEFEDNLTSKLDNLFG